MASTPEVDPEVAEGQPGGGHAEPDAGTVPASEAITIVWADLAGCLTAEDALRTWARNNDPPTYNGWASVVSQIRRRYPGDRSFLRESSRHGWAA